LNVLFFTSWYPTPAHTYAGVFVREHAKAARDAGHQVVVLHLGGPHPEGHGGLWTMQDELDPSLSEGIETHHVFHRKFPVRGASYPLYVWSAILAYRRLCDDGFRPDVFHAHVYAAGLPAAVIGSRAGIPVVLTEHLSGFPRRTLGRVELRKARYAYKRTARALPVSHYLQEAIKSYGIEAPFEVVPNVVDTSLFVPPDVERGEEGVERRLLFVGNLESAELKGFPTLLAALVRLFERRNDWRLDVIGDGPERARYETAAADLGLRGQVTFHGSQPKWLVAEMMGAADLLVAPSRIETFGAVIAEALVSGLPVVSTRVGGIPELIDDCNNGTLVSPDDPVALANALYDTLEDLCAFDRAAIAAAARDRYSLEVVGNRLTEIYESVVAESRANTGRHSQIQRQRRPIRHEHGS
jgi:glycosyltransferase involved in cell wall biosynthesis